MNWASKNCEGATDCQPAGTVHMELTRSVGAAGIAAAVTAAMSTAGAATWAETEALSLNVKDLRNWRKLSFWEVTNASSPVNLKNQLIAPRVCMATRLR